MFLVNRPLRTLVCVHFELVRAGPVTSASTLAAVAIPFPPEMTRGGMATGARSNDWPTIKTEAGATTEESSDEAEC
jgi:hypothetical protein